MEFVIDLIKEVEYELVELLLNTQYNKNDIDIKKKSMIEMKDH